MDNNNISIKQSLQLLQELDELIEKDYQEALAMIEAFKQETELLREQNSLSEDDVLDISKNLDIFERQYI